MPRKAAKRARTSKPVERDWRATLFVWRGELEIGGSPDTGPQISWRGAWLGTDDDTMPSDAALKASANTFELKTEPFDEEQIQEKSNATLVGTEFEGEECGGSEMVFEAIDMILGGMDEEDPEAQGLLPAGWLVRDEIWRSTNSTTATAWRSSDDTHRWEVRSWPKAAPGRSSRDHAAVAAVGTTPFGRFAARRHRCSTMTLRAATSPTTTRAGRRRQRRARAVTQRGTASSRRSRQAPVEGGLLITRLKLNNTNKIPTRGCYRRTL